MITIANPMDDWAKFNDFLYEVSAFYDFWRFDGWAQMLDFASCDGGEGGVSEEEVGDDWGDDAFDCASAMQWLEKEYPVLVNSTRWNRMKAVLLHAVMREVRKIRVFQ